MVPERTSAPLNQLRLPQQLLARRERAYEMCRETMAMSKSLCAEGSILLDHHRRLFGLARDEFHRVLESQSPNDLLRYQRAS